MALRNDWDDLMGDVEWEESEIDSGYFDSDNEAGNPGSWKTSFLFYSVLSKKLVLTSYPNKNFF